ncbi:hypothetical protein [Gracilibacillus sp. YIM 98692]|uniref:hypothetical protein n=1 Tax=Gracilibacillus sp. YIM 98692 TaxID=2663532 RepID=UPI0013CF98AE|nr:hypothetical protein [Gracilibacillus sp. YIM 98692]
MFEYQKENGILYKIRITKNGTVVKAATPEYYTKVSTNQTSIPADGQTEATITAEIYNYLDEPQTEWEGDIIFEVEGQEQTVSTTNGQAEITFSSEEPGDFTIKTNVPQMCNGEVVIHAT